MLILENLHDVLTRIERAARRAGRDPAAIELVAVTKKADAETVATLLSSGRVRQLGENRVQDAALKRRALEGRAGKASWRMIGHLQRNKARQALETFDAVDSVDSLELAERLDGLLRERRRTLPVLVQVKLTARETQSGVEPGSLAGFLERVRALRTLELRGLMGIAPQAESAEGTRPHFRTLRELRDRFLPGGALSMGMSQDFEVAIEEGADMVRVGSALFR